MDPTTEQPLDYAPIRPSDDNRVRHAFATLNGRRYHYVHGLPQDASGSPVTPRNTVLCIHGFPDLWYSWRHTIPALLSLGCEVIAPDMIGYGQTDAPRVPPNSLSDYSWKRTSDDLAALLKELGVKKAVLVAHDWGGVVAYRTYIWHPEIVSAIAVYCTPFFPPHRTYLPPEEMIKVLPNFTYQVAFMDPQTEKDLESKEAIRNFLSTLHRGTKDAKINGKFQVVKDIVKSIGINDRGHLLTEEDLDYYVEQYSRNGMHGPLNWYKTREINHLDEKDLGHEKDTVDVPVLYVAATYDGALPPAMAKHQPEFIKNLTEREMPTGHFVMAEAPNEANRTLKEWFEGVCFGDKSKL